MEPPIGAPCFVTRDGGGPRRLRLIARPLGGSRWLQFCRWQVAWFKSGCAGIDLLRGGGTEAVTSKDFVLRRSVFPFCR